MRIVISTHTFLPTVGGAEVGIDELATRLARRHSVVVLAQGAHAADQPELPYGVVRVTARPGGRRSFAARVAERTGLAFLWALIRLRLTAGPIDVVNVHFFRTNTVMVLACRHLLRIPVVLTLTGRTDVVSELPGWRRRLAALLIGSSAAVIANADYYLRGTRLAGREVIVGFGVDTARFAPSGDRDAIRRSLGVEDDEFLVLAVQRLEPLKRVDHVIEAVALARRSDPRIRLLVTGTGPQEAELRRLGDERLGDAVTFTGLVPREQLPDLYRAADAFVSQSAFETFGLVFIEAMGAGLPIIAAEAAAVCGVLTGAEATVVPDGDLDAVAATLRAWSADRELGRQKGRAGRERACREFDWERAATAYEAVFEAVSR